MTPPRQPAYGLTRREREVLGQVAAGRTDREIAEALFISESTDAELATIDRALARAARTEGVTVIG